MLNITVEQEPLDKPVAFIHLEGELDHQNYKDVIAKARELRDSGVVRLVLDLSDLDYMGSSGIFALRSIAVIVGANEPPDPDSGYGAVQEQGEEDGDDHEQDELLGDAERVADHQRAEGLHLVAEGGVPGLGVHAEADGARREQARHPPVDEQAAQRHEERL